MRENHPSTPLRALLGSTTNATSKVVDEILAGQGKSLSTLARLLPARRGEGRVRPSTVWRWVRDGVCLASGEVVRLEACQIAGRLLSTEAALKRFLSAQQAQPAPAPVSSPAPAPTPPPGNAARNRREEEIARAEGEAEQMGL